MTIKNKKTKQSKTSEVTSSGSASTSVQKTSSTTSVQSSSSNTVQKVSSSGKKVRYIEVKVEEDDPLMITDISDHTSIAGSTISEHYNSHPHYIITEAPSISDLSQTRALEHNVSDMAQSTSGEYVSSSVLQESSSSHQNSKTETFQTSSTSVQQSGSSHSQSFDRTTDSSAPNQTLNTGFIDNSSSNVHNSNTYVKRSQNANASNSFLQSERQNLINQTKSNTNDQRNTKQNERVTYRNSPEPSQRTQTVRSDSSNFYGGEGSLDKRGNTKEYTSTSQTSETKSSNVTKSSSSSYVVEIVDGKERIVDSSKREWGDAQEHSSKEDYASISGTGMKPQSAHSVQNYDMKANYDTGKDGKRPTSELTVKQDSKFIKDGNQMTSHSSITTEKDNVAKHQQYITDREHLTDDQQYLTNRDQVTTDQKYVTNRDNLTSDQRHNTSRQYVTSDQQHDTNRQYLTSDQQHNTSRQYLTSDQQYTTSEQSTTDQHYTTREHLTSDQQYTTREHTTSDKQTSSIKDDHYQKRNVSNNTNQNRRDVVDNVTTVNKEIVDDRRRNMNQTDSSNFYGYDTTIQNELRKVGNILQVPNTENINFSTKIMKSNTSSAQQASTSSYVVEIVDGKERIVDTSHREWGDNKEHSTYEKSHNVSGTGIKPEHEYTRHVLDKESHYDTGKDGVPKSSLQVSEESSLYKNGKEIASTSNRYGGDFTKKKAITEYVTDRDDVHDTRVHDTTDQTTTYKTTTTDTQSVRDIKDVKDTTDFVTTEKENLTKESTSKTTSQTKDTLTTYERSTGTWNGKFVYETDDDRPKRPKEMSPFGRPEQPRHHLKRQDTEENIILSSRDIKDFTSISDLRKIIESSKFNKDVRVSNKNIVINRNIDDRILKEIIDTVKKYPFKRIEKVTFGTKINEDVKDLYEGLDTEETTVVSTTTGETTRKAFEVEKNRSQIEVTRYITENGITRKITTYEDAKEDDKIRTDVYVDKSALDFKNLVSILQYVDTPF